MYFWVRSITEACKLARRDKKSSFQNFEWPRNPMFTVVNSRYPVRTYGRSGQWNLRAYTSMLLPKKVSTSFGWEAFWGARAEGLSFRGAWETTRFSTGLRNSSPFYGDFCMSAVSCIWNAPIMFTSSIWSHWFFKIYKSPVQRVSCSKAFKTPSTELIDPGV